MNTKRPFLVLVIAVLITTLACEVGSVPVVGPLLATKTPTPTNTPTPTPTPRPTATPTPRPTATPKPTTEDVLLDNGFTRNTGLESCDGIPCRTYTGIFFDANGMGILTAGVFDSGEFRIAYMMSEVSATSSLDNAILIIGLLYGYEIASWFENHFPSADSVYSGNGVVDGHWVATGVGQIDSETVRILLIISPDASKPPEITID